MVMQREGERGRGKHNIAKPREAVTASKIVGGEEKGKGGGRQRGRRGSGLQSSPRVLDKQGVYG